MKYLIIGGTGTLGRALARSLLDGDEFCRVTIFSRDELKQKEMERDFQKNPRLHFRIGDIRDRHSISSVLNSDTDVVFHVAALKHVDSGEQNPEEFKKTNIDGTINVADAAIAAGVRYVVFSSTDKAVDPINAYGMSKALAEKILLRRNEYQKLTRFSVFRWGNVLGSRGSAIPAFVNGIKSGEVALTDARMTRFWIKIEDAVKFMVDNYEKAPLDSAMIPSCKAASVSRVIHALAHICKVSDYKTIEIPIRPGEKIHEFLTSQHTRYPVSSDTATQYTDSELIELVRGCM